MGFCPVLFIEPCVPFIVDRIIRLHSRLPLAGILFGDDRRRLLSEGKVLVFYDPCIGDLCLCIVDDRTSLIVVRIGMLVFESHAPILKIAEAEIKKFIDRSRKDSLISHIRV